MRPHFPGQANFAARKVGETPIGLFATRAYFDRRGRVAAKDDLRQHDLIGLDRKDFLIRGFAGHDIHLTRDDFALRTDDGMLTWNLLLAGVGQVVLARRHPELEQVDAELGQGALPVWLVMSEEVRTNARIRRVADFLSSALTDILRGGSSAAKTACRP